MLGAVTLGASLSGAGKIAATTGAGLVGAATAAVATDIAQDTRYESGHRAGSVEERAKWTKEKERLNDNADIFIIERLNYV